jgi:hypothetical protein
VKVVECRIGAGRRGFLEQQDAVAVSPPSSVSAAERPGAMLNIEPPPGGTTKPFAFIFTSSQCS